MILVENAVIKVDQIPVFPKKESVELNRALNRILAQDVMSKIDMPPFHKSAMDGYAFNSRDTSEEFQVIETIQAGQVPAKKVIRGQCAKIMTGGMVPDGADRVIKKELTIEKNGFMRIIEEEKNKNICFRGEDIKINDVVLKKGILIRPQEIGVLASMGWANLKVFKKPEAGIIATGSELVEPGFPLHEGQIYDSNTYSLAAQVEQTGASLKSTRRIMDNRENIKAAVRETINTCDLILISGGVSVGEFDYVPEILKELGVRLYFEKVAIKPGKPTVFGTLNEKIIFGVPGNPVSTFVVFEIFIKQLLFRMMGHDFHPVEVTAVLEETFKRHKADRTSFIPVYYQGGSAKGLIYHGSAHFHALSQANGLISIPRGVKELQAGSTIHVRLV